MTKPIGLCFVWLVCLALVGCGAKVGDVAGKVTFKDKPVVYGSVVVIGADGIPKSGAIQPDGSYVVVGVAVGNATVTVSSPPPPGNETATKARPGGRDSEPSDKVPPPSTAGAPVAGWFAIPTDYGDPRKSGLTVVVGSGTTTNDILLK